ncbi:hypothetical protein J5J83_12490 [Azoarcus sp. L1K30]|uniref:hypothetical protein n=1 Tax=Azoarcus sp. L1K30 TaxID=2820277 RepID=UPI001B814704|nr:hypothetical protein [Azoarcus sp. L1K30]MBR0566932.1 hypothetical protein [Azoarcus sp. L1K30]
MISSPTLRIAASALLICLYAPLGHGADDNAVTDSERSRQLKNEAAQLRKQAEAQYQAAEPACYQRFLVNSCIDSAKQEHLDSIRRARALEAEARKIDLAERQRAASKAMADNPGAPQSASAPSPAGNATVAPQPEAEQLRADRARAAAAAEHEADLARAARDETRSRERDKAAAAAAQRAEDAARERARYDARIREYEEKKARDAAGR